MNRKVAWALLACTARGVAADPEAVLDQARKRLQSLTHSLSNYACIETVERRYYRPVEPPVCSPEAAFSANAKLESTDRLRLEVTVSEGREIYSWPGATRFDSRDIDDIIRQGPIGTGSFGTHLLGIFDTPGVAFHYTAERSHQGHTVLEYQFHVPREASHYRIKVDAQWQAMPYEGVFWLNPQSFELERLSITVADVPAETSICALNAELDYQPVRIGTTEALLPSEGQLHIAMQNARTSNNVTTFANCREYVSESALSFDEGTGVQQTVRRTPARPIAIPLGLPVTLALTTAIDTATAAAGDPITARVVKDVPRPGTNQTLIPAGATVRGRITRAEQHLLPSPYALVAISFNRLVIDDASYPFAARSEGNPDLAKDLGVNIFGPGQGLGFWDVGTFLFHGAKARVLPAGYQTKWITLAIRGR